MHSKRGYHRIRMIKNIDSLPHLYMLHRLLASHLVVVSFFLARCGSCCPLHGVPAALCFNRNLGFSYSHLECCVSRRLGPMAILLKIPPSQQRPVAVARTCLQLISWAWPTTFVLDGHSATVSATSGGCPKRGHRQHLVMEGELVNALPLSCTTLRRLWLAKSITLRY